MSDSLKQLVSLLVEQALREDDAPADAPFGKWLFGQDQKPHKGEPDTNIETKFGDLLANHYDHYGESTELFSFYFKYIKPEIQKGNYAQYLAPPSTTVYRGISVSINKYQEMFDVKKAVLQDTEYVFETGGLVLEQKTYKMKSGVLNSHHTGIMSWTLSEKIAKRFIFKNEIGTDKAYVIFKAQTTNNDFFINPTETKANFQYGPFKEWSHEQEVISAGPVKYDEATVYVYEQREI